MIRALRTAASGMTAQQLNVDNIANNLANVNTTGFKKAKVEFQDIMYQSLRKPGVQSAIGAMTPTALDIGYGARPVATTREYSVGKLQQTGNPLDVAIDGDGFFQIQQPDGTIAYSRDGSIKLTAEGRLATSDGYLLTPEITIPQDASSISIAVDGKVSVVQAGSNTPPRRRTDRTGAFYQSRRNVGHRPQLVSGNPSIRNASSPVFRAKREWARSIRGIWKCRTSTWSRRWST